jgi:hypothetical protein
MVYDVLSSWTLVNSCHMCRGILHAVRNVAWNYDTDFATVLDQNRLLYAL